MFEFLPLKSIFDTISATLKWVSLLVVAFGAMFFSFTFAELDKKNYLQVDADLFSRLRYDHKGGSTFQTGPTSPIDSGGVSFLGHLPIENTELDIKIAFSFEDRDTATRYNLQFDEAYLRASNLFGFMDIKFFDIGYGAGEGNGIRPDLPARGVQFYFHPVSELVLSLGYGISSGDFNLYPMSNNIVQTSLQGQETSYTPNYHVLKFDLIYENLYVPTSLYYGIALVDNAGSYLDKEYLPGIIQDKILHTSVGFSLDLLAFFKRGAMGFDVGFGIPLGAMSRYVKIDDDGEHSYESEFNFLFQFYGDVNIVYGFGLKYQLLFALDSHTKQKTLGNLYDEYFKEAFQVAFTPRYAYGPVSADIGLMFAVVGGMAARSSIDHKDSIIYKRGVYNNLFVETGLDWTPFPFSGIGRDLTVRGYYKIDFGDLDNSGDHYNEIGMQLSLSFNTLAID